MFGEIFDIVAPVFIVIAAGYAATTYRLFERDKVDALMNFAIRFAVPCLLFRATSTMDLAAAYDWRVLAAFYSGASLSFVIGILLMRKVFGRRPGEAVAIGFSALFSNLVLMGLSISERAWGLDSVGMQTAFAIVSLHAPFCYLLGITAMELLRADGRSMVATAGIVTKAMFRNSLMIGIGLGFAVNLTGLPVPDVLASAIETVAHAALPVALFGLGGTLTRYRLKDSLGEAAAISTLSLVVHPATSLAICLMLGVADALTDAAVLLAAMAPGVNGYIFAAMYNRGMGTAASTVLLGTMASVLSVSAWLWLLGVA